MKHRVFSTKRYRRCAIALVAVTTLASAALALPLLASSPAHALSSGSAKVRYIFKKLDDSRDPTSNALLGINDHAKIVGYFGSGAHGHPFRGYILLPPYRQADYRNHNFPGSKQTLVSGLNNTGIYIGSYSMTNKVDELNAYVGFYSSKGKFHKVSFPARHPFNPPTDQLTGVNDSGIAIGYYLDSAGTSHGYIYEISSHRYLTVDLGVAGASVWPTGINDSDNSVGFFYKASGGVRGFLLRNGSRRPVILNFPGSSNTYPYGINKYGVVVGYYTIDSEIFGFTWAWRHGYQKISYPGAFQETVVDGINSAGDLVGFYIGSHGNYNGFLARP